jgi:uncharacterized protein with NRDE domain
VCLVIAYSRAVRGTPVLIAANRDEMRSRPAIAMDVLRDREPRILGGRDLVARGTWLAVNEWGVVAALTNSPSTLGPGAVRNPARPSRGEIPLRLARHRTAREAIAQFQREEPLDEYAGCFVLVGDRDSLHYLALGDGTHSPAIELAAGIHVLENRPIEAASPKSDFVRERLPKPSEPRLLRGLWGILQSRAVPTKIDPAAPGPSRPPESEAAYVELGPYGTRWSGIVAVPRRGRSRFLFSEQPSPDGRMLCAHW